jgi:hypothetical protein
VFFCCFCFFPPIVPLFSFLNSHLFPIYFVSCFFQIWSFVFWFSVCFPFVLLFSSLKIIRINYRGEHNYSQFSGVKSPLSDTPEYHIVACTPNYPIWSHYIPMLLPYCWLNHRICMYIHIYIYTIRQSNIAMEKNMAHLVRIYFPVIVFWKRSMPMALTVNDQRVHTHSVRTVCAKMP